MRIIKEYPHPIYKVSIFRSGSRYHVKIQDKRIAISYTLSEDQCETVQEVERWIENEVIEKTAVIFPQLENVAVSALNAMERGGGSQEVNII